MSAHDNLNTMIVAVRPQVVPDDLGHYLHGLSGSQMGRHLEVGGSPVTVGRGDHATLVIPDDQEVSRRHARFALVNGEVIVEDLGSTNGTFVDAVRVSGPVHLREGNVVRIGAQTLKYERRRRYDVERARELDDDLRRANGYVLSLLPPPLTSGAVRTEWHFAPSSQLGGDGFGYYWLDATTFVFYLIDVSGHGVGPAMHSVAVLNVLRQRALPNVDFQNPAAVLSSLNARFQMSDYGGLYFTAWYGVYSTTNRTLTFSSAGHHPAYLVDPQRQGSRAIGEPALMIGVMPHVEYDVHQTTVPPNHTLYFFSDGVFEIVASDQRRWALSDFLPLILRPLQSGTPEPLRLFRAVTEAAGSNQLEDDFSLVTAQFA